MQLKFTKMHGCGNDYIYFNCIENPRLIPDPSAIAPKLADRHFGIGGDGIVLILKDDKADFRMRMFSSDGSEAEMCGNAIRCVTKYLCDNEYVTGEQVDIATGAGVKHITVTRDADGPRGRVQRDVVADGDGGRETSDGDRADTWRYAD